MTVNHLQTAALGLLMFGLALAWCFYALMIA